MCTPLLLDWGIDMHESGGPEMVAFGDMLWRRIEKADIYSSSHSESMGEPQEGGSPTTVNDEAFYFTSLKFPQRLVCLKTP